MSSVRMCDKCNRVFSEREDGWQTFTGSTFRKVRGKRELVSEVLDMCPDCAIGDIIPDEEQDERKTLETRIAKLERETGMDAETGTFGEKDVVT